MTGHDVAELLGSELIGPAKPVTRLSTPSQSTDDAVVVLSTTADLEALGDRVFGVAVVAADLQTEIEPRVPVERPRAALAALAQRFDRRPVPTGVAPSAIVDPTAVLGDGVAIGPGAVIGKGATLGSRATVGAGSVVGEGAALGDDCRLHAHVTLYDGVRLGHRVIVHSGCVIGADGFGYAATDRGARKIHHLGTVRIGDDVEIGANTCIDRGTLSDTVIGDRTKIDNLCQIAHNVRIGTDCLIAGHSGVSGSVELGDRVTLGGGVGLVDHIHIGTGATLGGGAVVTKDVPAGETWIGAIPARPYRSFARLLYLMGKLEEVWAFVKARR